jgi:GNAT superfamily N-acetyltransferase
MRSSTVRLATIEDADAIGGVHTRAWQTAYRGIMDGDYLDGLRAEERADMWRRRIGREDADSTVLVVEAGGDVVGFAILGPSTGSETSTGELYAINLDPPHWRKGLGRQLFDVAVQSLRDGGFTSAVLWVAIENDRARWFYEAAGWQPDGAERVDTVMEATVAEVRYRCSLL